MRVVHPLGKADVRRRAKPLEPARGPRDALGSAPPVCRSRHGIDDDEDAGQFCDNASGWSPKTNRRGCYRRSNSDSAIVKPTATTMRRTLVGPILRATPAPQMPPMIAPTAITSACGHDTMPLPMK